MEIFYGTCLQYFLWILNWNVCYVFLKVAHLMTDLIQHPELVLDPVMIPHSLVIFSWWEMHLKTQRKLSTWNVSSFPFLQDQNLLPAKSISYLTRNNHFDFEEMTTAFPNLTKVGQDECRKSWSPCPIRHAGCRQSTQSTRTNFVKKYFANLLLLYFVLEKWPTK